MANYLELYNIRDQILQRATIAVLKIADYILTAEDPGTGNHANRVIWATAALQDPAPKARELLWQIMANGDVQQYGEGVADSVIQYVVETKLDGYATGA